MTAATLKSAMNKLAKWRTVFASWQLGTRVSGDAECNAVKDHREVTILLRAEVTALLSILLQKKICTDLEFAEVLKRECELLDEDYEKRFPGFKTHQYGVDIDLNKAAKTMEGWRP